MSTPDRSRALSDDELLDLVAAVLHEDEAPPAGAVELAIGALAWRDVDADLADLLHDSVLEEAVVLREDATTARLIVFQAGGVTLDIEQDPERLTGSISPPGHYRVAVQRGRLGPGAAAEPAVLTDDAGMFEVQGQLHGSIRFHVSDSGGQVRMVSAWITL